MPRGVYERKKKVPVKKTPPVPKKSVAEDVVVKTDIPRKELTKAYYVLTTISNRCVYESDNFTEACGFAQNYPEVASVFGRRTKK